MDNELLNTEIIATNSKIKEILNKYNLMARKNFGQNFLTDTHVINKIIKASEITKEDLVIEVGPGIGSLTQFLALEAKKVIAIEIDRNMVEVLKETLMPYKNVEVINNDILKVDIGELFDKNEYKSVKVVANLPYYITTPIIMKFLEGNNPIDIITVMVQKEVAQRMAAVHSTKEYGSLSIAVQYYAEIYLAANVPRNCFIPRPNVDSAVIRLKKRDKPAVTSMSEELMFKLIKTAFSSRRKTLLNCIFNSPNFNLNKEQIAALLNKSGLDEKIRGENLTIEQFSLLANNFYELNSQGVTSIFLA